MSCLVMEIRIKVNFRTARHMEKELTFGRMVRFMMESGRKDRSKDMVCGKVYTETAILGSGMPARLKDMVFILGSMEIGMKVNGNNA